MYSKRNGAILKPDQFHKLRPWVKLYTDAVDPALATPTLAKQSRKETHWAEVEYRAVSNDSDINGTGIVFDLPESGFNCTGSFYGRASDKTEKHFEPVCQAIHAVADQLYRRNHVIRITGNDPYPVTHTPDYLPPLESNPWLLDVVANVLGRTDFSSIRSEENTGRVKAITMSAVGTHPFAYVLLKDKKPETGNITGLLKVGADGEYGCDIIGSLDRKDVNPAFFKKLFERVPAIVQDMAWYQRTLTNPALSVSAQQIAYQNKWLKPFFFFLVDNDIKITDLTEEETCGKGTSVLVKVIHTHDTPDGKPEAVTLHCINPEKGYRGLYNDMVHWVDHPKPLCLCRLNYVLRKYKPA